MRALWALLVAACLSGQEAKPPNPSQSPTPDPPPAKPRLNLPKRALTPQEMLRAMVAQDQARRGLPRGHGGSDWVRR
ncbi:hypothetical protein [Geothrix sp. PMB-07]|uniref:hypothetical protein n=1 Tax=Geothrix sp. PMB-07 TaxID=3068640 RepID=UPI0027422603|nr:hypothetical protein [Geothrix sp. PMB-07]WLT33207.1 hypothetical protein Q9293_07705 [Geothrix sp. PMB-07]